MLLRRWKPELQGVSRQRIGAVRRLVRRSCVLALATVAASCSMDGKALESQKERLSEPSAPRAEIDLARVDVFELLAANATALSGSHQALVVAGEGQSRFVRVWLAERRETWQIALGGEHGMPGAIGAHGFAPPGRKREGDKCTPTGVFTMTEAFGDSPFDSRNPQTRLPYRTADASDWWCDDPTSPDYNTWVKRPLSQATSSQAVGTLPSAENLHRDDDLYRLVVVIDYNRWPVVPGMGSGIFLHKADPEGAGTLGCVGLSEADLRAVVARLDPSQSPRVLLGTIPELLRGLPK